MTDQTVYLDHDEAVIIEKIIEGGFVAGILITAYY